MVSSAAHLVDEKVNFDSNIQIYESSFASPHLIKISSSAMFIKEVARLSEKIFFVENENNKFHHLII